MSPPPPPPGAAQPRTEPPQAVQTDRDQDTILLIRAMIASAYADGMLDAEERKRIVEKLEVIGMTDEERTFITNELLNPSDIQTIVQQVNTPELARQVYAASLIAIHVDTEQERNYLRTLASSLSIDRNAIQQIHDQLGIQPMDAVESRRETQS